MAFPLSFSSRHKTQEGCMFDIHPSVDMIAAAFQSRTHLFTKRLFCIDVSGNNTLLVFRFDYLILARGLVVLVAVGDDRRLQRGGDGILAFILIIEVNAIVVDSRIHSRSRRHLHGIVLAEEGYATPRHIRLDGIHGEKAEIRIELVVVLVSNLD